MKILIAFDKFKGSVSAQDACNSLGKGILEVLPNTILNSQPMADGGEGSLSILSSVLPIRLKSVQTVDALMKPITAQYGIFGNVAYIETSASCGLQLLETDERNPLKTSTFGVGLMIEDAIDQGCTEIHLFLGGSATNDGGIGMAAALGYILLDKNNNEVYPIGQNMINIQNIVNPTDYEKLLETRFYSWTDVQVDLTGQKGATKMFAKQKGASAESIDTLESGMLHLESIFGSKFDKLVTNDQQGLGASGGLAAGTVFFLNAIMGSGITFIMESTELEHKIKQADIIITGEGSVDEQSIEGKVIAGIARVCQKYDKKLILVAGRVILSPEKLHKLGFAYHYALMDYTTNQTEAIKNGKFFLKQIGKDIAYSLKM